MEFREINCPNCGVSIETNAFDTTVKCTHCGSFFRVSATAQEFAREGFVRTSNFMNKNGKKIFITGFLFFALPTIFFLIVLVFMASKFQI